MSNAEAMRRLRRLTHRRPHLPQKEAAEQVSEETGVDFLYLYWLPRNFHRKDPDAHARSSAG